MYLTCPPALCDHVRRRSAHNFGDEQCRIGLAGNSYRPIYSFCLCLEYKRQPQTIEVQLEIEPTKLIYHHHLLHITIHYRHFTRHLHLKWPVVLQQCYVLQKAKVENFSNVWIYNDVIQNINEYLFGSTEEVTFGACNAKFDHLLGFLQRIKFEDIIEPTEKLREIFFHQLKFLKYLCTSQSKPAEKLSILFGKKNNTSAKYVDTVFEGCDQGCASWLTAGWTRD